VNGTYQLTNIPFGSARTVRIVVHVKAGVPVDTIRSWLVVATSTGDATKQDAVKARIRVA